MSGSSRSRQKRKLEPISIEELAGTTGMSGFCTFLTRDTSVAVPALDRREPETTAPDSAAPQTTAPIINVLSAPEIDPGEKGTANLTAPEIGAANSSALDYVFRRRIRIREAVTVQDGHSLAEQAVYDAMYRAGKPYQGDARILTIGLRTLAELSRMAYSNCKVNVRSLVAKQAIDEGEGFSYTDGRTYIIYSFREILRRRKATGLTHVIRNRGVAFVDPTTGAPISGAPDSGEPKKDAAPVSALTSDGSALARDRSSAPSNLESGAPVADAHIRNRHLVRNGPQESSSFLPPLVSALRRYIPDVDDDAAAELWTRCLENAPGAQVTEVVHFIDLKAGKPGIRMPLGFLLTAVPKCFLGDAYRQFCEERSRTRESGQSRDRMFAEEILRSPEADEEQKQWAREVLNGGS